MQDLHEERLERFAEATAEGGEGVVVGMAVAGEVTKGDGVVGGHFDAAAGEYAGGITVDKQTHQAGGVIGIAAASGVGAFDVGETEARTTLAM